MGRAQSDPAILSPTGRASFDLLGPPFLPAAKWQSHFKGPSDVAANETALLAGRSVEIVMHSGRTVSIAGF